MPVYKSIIGAYLYPEANRFAGLVINASPVSDSIDNKEITDRESSC